MLSTGLIGAITLSDLYIPRDTLTAHTIVSNVCNKDGYKYGYNGQLKDNEWAGLGNHLDFGERGVDTRTGRWITVDKLGSKYPGVSPYAFVRNSPIVKYDPDGNTDYTATVTQAKSGGNITKSVTVEVNYAVLNISSKDMYNSNEVSGSGYGVQSFSGSFEDKDLKGNFFFSSTPSFCKLLIQKLSE